MYIVHCTVYGPIGGFNNLLAIFFSQPVNYLFIYYIKGKTLLKTNEEDKEDGHFSLVVQGALKRLTKITPSPLPSTGPKICIKIARCHFWKNVSFILK